RPPRKWLRPLGTRRHPRRSGPDRVRVAMLPCFSSFAGRGDRVFPAAHPRRDVDWHSTAWLPICYDIMKTWGTVRCNEDPAKRPRFKLKLSSFKPELDLPLARNLTLSTCHFVPR